MLLVTQPSPVSLCPSAVCEKWLFGNLIRKTFSRLCWGPPPRLFFRQQKPQARRTTAPQRRKQGSKLYPSLGGSPITLNSCAGHPNKTGWR